MKLVLNKLQWLKTIVWYWFNIVLLWLEVSLLTKFTMHLADWNGNWIREYKERNKTLNKNINKILYSMSILITPCSYFNLRKQLWHGSRLIVGSLFIFCIECEIIPTLHILSNTYFYGITFLWYCHTYLLITAFEWLLNIISLWKSYCVHVLKEALYIINIQQAT